MQIQSESLFLESFPSFQAYYTKLMFAERKLIWKALFDFNVSFVANQPPLFVIKSMLPSMMRDHIEC